MLVRLDLLLASQGDGRIPAPPLLCLAQFPLPLPAFGFRREVFEILQEVPQPRPQRPPRTVAVEGNREAHAPRLASALSNLGADLADRADWSGAVRGAEEALALRRELVSRHPKAFEPQLARLLWWMAGIRLRGDHDLPDASGEIEEGRYGCTRGWRPTFPTCIRTTSWPYGNLLRLSTSWSTRRTVRLSEAPVSEPR
ncbi:MULTISPECIES: tetratricopeptide repeat protein [unclassified Streptomyces]|uniref:tetratricopeptide repeat protein n=1 Tax=unclassified Streptomyces TaxID=2593676 RepID=UPI0036555B5C